MMKFFSGKSIICISLIFTLTQAVVLYSVDGGNRMRRRNGFAPPYADQFQEQPSIWRTEQANYQAQDGLSARNAQQQFVRRNTEPVSQSNSDLIANQVVSDLQDANEVIGEFSGASPEGQKFLNYKRQRDEEYLRRARVRDSDNWQVSPLGQSDDTTETRTPLKNLPVYWTTKSRIYRSPIDDMGEYEDPELTTYAGRPKFMFVQSERPQGPRTATSTHGPRGNYRKEMRRNKKFRAP
jgi:hypothetical protein